MVMPLRADPPEAASAAERRSGIVPFGIIPAPY